LLDPEERKHDLPKRRCPIIALHDFEFQKIVLFLTTIICQDSTVGTPPSYEQDDWDSIPGRRSVQAGCGVDLATYSMGSWQLFLGDKAAAA
jgi:hypothetical protein